VQLIINWLFECCSTYQASIEIFIAMFDTICSLPLTADLFSQAIHPFEPIVAVGLSSGHVQSFKLPPAPTSAQNSPSPDEVPIQPFGRRRSSTASENGRGEIETAWRTRRHKGSCRSLAYSPDGALLYSAGTDGLVKAAGSEDGRVVEKIAIPDIDWYVARFFPSVGNALLTF
jgi:WD repeat-containing protein 55